MKNTHARINHSVWELAKLIAKRPDSYSVKADFLRFFHDSRIYLERKNGISEEDRSFLLLQEHEALCCCLLHGIAGSPREMRPLGEHLYRAGYTVYGMRLALGNDDAGGQAQAGAQPGARPPWRRGSRNHGGYNWERCLCDADTVVNALLTFSPSTYAFGFSFGGTIVLNLMRKRPIKAAVLIAPGLFRASYVRLPLFSFLRKLAPFIAREAFPREYALLQFVERTRGHVPAIEQPMLVIQASRDHVVSPRSLQFMRERSSNPKSRFELVDSERHVIVTGDTAPLVYRLCTDFLREI